VPPFIEYLRENQNIKYSYLLKPRISAPKTSEITTVGQGKIRKTPYPFYSMASRYPATLEPIWHTWSQFI